MKEALTLVKQGGSEDAKWQAFSNLLEKMFGGNPDNDRVIKDFILGTQAAVKNIDLGDGKHKRGKVDTQYGAVIIEFEKSMKKTGSHARDQLIEYLVGNWRENKNENFILIATDCETWVVYTADYNAIADITNLNVKDVKLDVKQEFIWKERNGEEFYYFLDRYLFAKDQIKPTLARIQDEFGHGSPVYGNCLRMLSTYWEKEGGRGENDVAYDQWRRFLSHAYGKFDESPTTFLVHTYLSVLSKMLAYLFLSHDDYIDENEMAGILSGDIFQHHRVLNLVEDDFFHWIGRDDAAAALRPMFKHMRDTLQRFDFSKVDEDILKGVYQELIDRDTRQSLGEYYTPDWLCERVVAHLQPLKADQKILDPTCGSGSFLRAVVDRLLRDDPEATAEQIANQVFGIDIHPLSVQIAKVTLLLALGEKALKTKRPISLNVYLANAILAPEKGHTLLNEDTFLIDVFDKHIRLSSEIYSKPELFHKMVGVCAELAEADKGKKIADPKGNLFHKAISHHWPEPLSLPLSNQFKRLYEAFREVKEAGRDTIWEFVVKNSYKPYFFRETFDVVVGNPPWFAYRSISNPNYQQRLRKLAEQYGVMPTRAANFTALEIATIFMAHACNYLLKPNGLVAFVLPRSVMSADQHDALREAKVNHMRLIECWDLVDVAPLFNIPSCVLWARQVPNNTNKAIPPEGIVGQQWQGKLPSHNANWTVAGERLTHTGKSFKLIRMGQSSALDIGESVASGENAYRDSFYNGATMYPRVFYFVDVDTHSQDDFSDRNGREYLVKTAQSVQGPEAKAPWKGIQLSGWVEGQYLYRTAVAKNIVPFGLNGTETLVLPAELNPEGTHLEMREPDTFRNAGKLTMHKWFRKVEDLWEERRTALNARYTAAGYANYQNKIVNQNLDVPLMVLYASSGKDASACVVHRGELNLPFIVDCKAYLYQTNSEGEAFYLTAFLNSGFANEAIKAFQSRGLFGQRDIHTKILDVPLPKYEDTPQQRRLAELARVCAEKVRPMIAKPNEATEQTAHSLGRLRLTLRKELETELAEIDTLLREICY